MRISGNALLLDPKRGKIFGIFVFCLKKLNGTCFCLWLSLEGGEILFVRGVGDVEGDDWWGELVQIPNYRFHIHIGRGNGTNVKCGSRFSTIPLFDCFSSLHFGGFVAIRCGNWKTSWSLVTIDPFKSMTRMFYQLWIVIFSPYLSIRQKSEC